MSDPVEAAIKAAREELEWQIMHHGKVSDPNAPGHAAIAAYHEALEADGWQVVPKVPSEAMKMAGAKRMKEESVGRLSIAKTGAHAVFESMLQAAPTPKDRDHE
jgi:hypothetical protein